MFPVVLQCFETMLPVDIVPKMTCSVSLGGGRYALLGSITSHKNAEVQCEQNELKLERNRSKMLLLFAEQCTHRKLLRIRIVKFVIRMSTTALVYI